MIDIRLTNPGDVVTTGCPQCGVNLTLGVISDEHVRHNQEVFHAMLCPSCGTSLQHAIMLTIATNVIPNFVDPPAFAQPPIIGADEEGPVFEKEEEAVAEVPEEALGVAEPKLADPDELVDEGPIKAGTGLWQQVQASGSTGAQYIPPPSYGTDPSPYRYQYTTETQFSDTVQKLASENPFAGMDIGEDDVVGPVDELSPPKRRRGSKKEINKEDFNDLF